MTESYSQLALEFKKTKSHSAYKKLYDKMRPALKSYIYNILKDRDVTEDILARTFIKVYEKIDDFDGVHSITTWAYTIAKRESVRYIKRERNPRISLSYINEMGGDAVDSDDAFGSVSGSKHSYSDDSKTETEMWEEEHEFMGAYNLSVQAIQNLRPLYRDILVDNLFNKMKYKDIAYKYDENLRKAQEDFDKNSGKKEKRCLEAAYKKALQRVKNRVRRGKFLVAEEVSKAFPAYQIKNKKEDSVLSEAE
jgi:RNA polymerase sigma factor (sigma-70 family)